MQNRVFLLSRQVGFVKNSLENCGTLSLKAYEDVYPSAHVSKWIGDGNVCPS